MKILNNYVVECSGELDNSQIIDDKDQIAENRSIDSFIAGFRLAWRLSNELNMYEKTRPMLTPREGVAGMDAFIHDKN